MDIRGVFKYPVCNKRKGGKPHGRDEKHLRKDPAGTAYKSAAGDRAEGDQHTAIHTAGH